MARLLLGALGATLLSRLINESHKNHRSLKLFNNLTFLFIVLEVLEEFFVQSNYSIPCVAFVLTCYSVK